MSPAPPSIGFADRASTRSQSRRAPSSAARCRSRSRAASRACRARRSCCAKADAAFSRAAKIEDTTIGWRFVNPLMKAKYGIDSMPETAENVAAEFGVSRADQDAFAFRSQARAAAAIAAGRLAEEIVPVTVACEEGRPHAGRARRAPARDDARGTREAQGDRPRRTERSPPATRRASTTAAAPRCSPRPKRRAATASRRKHAWLPRR